MLKINGTEIAEVKYNNINLEKVIYNGAVVFEKRKKESFIMRSASFGMLLRIKTQDGSACEVWNNNSIKRAVLPSNKKTYFEFNTNEKLFVLGEKIIEIECPQSSLTELRFKGLRSLEMLDCSYNKLTELNLLGLSNLKELQCSTNQLKTLTMDDSENLQKLFCHGNQLTELSINKLLNLKYLTCSENQLAKLDVRDLVHLEDLSCDRNKLTKLYFNGLIRLKSFSCSENQLTELNISNLPKLEWLSCLKNKLQDLRVNNITSLKYFDSRFNQLSAHAFEKLFNALPNRPVGNNGEAVLYSYDDLNYKDFSKPPELHLALENARLRGWSFYQYRRHGGKFPI